MIFLESMGDLCEPLYNDKYTKQRQRLSKMIIKDLLTKDLGDLGRYRDIKEFLEYHDLDVFIKLKFKYKQK